MGKLTVIIPVYNQEQLVLRALESVPKRNDVDTIIVNDGSTDATADVIRNYVETHRDRKIFFENFSENRGVASATNAGLDLATGEYVVLLGSDDYFLTDKLETLIDHYLDGTDLVYFNLRINGGECWKISRKNKTVLCGSVKIMRRDFIGDTRCPDGKKWGEDYDFYTQLLQKNPTETFTDITVKHYNYPRIGSLTDQMFKEVRKNG